MSHENNKRRTFYVGFTPDTEFGRGRIEIFDESHVCLFSESLALTAWLLADLAERSETLREHAAAANSKGVTR